MAFERGSLVLVGYTAKLDDGTVIEVANHDGYVPDEVHNFSSGPKLVSVGDPSYPVLRGFDRALADAELDAPQTVTVQPADAYGERRRDKVKMITARKLGKDADRYTVGDMVEVDNNTGVILSMGSGRVRVDFNHIFAGKSITYEFTVLKQLESDTDKIEALLAQSGMLEDYDPLEPDGDLDDLDTSTLGGGEGSTDEDLDAA
ncbi:MAG: FKBP-type peptidyl-prolyl cis-trans isomerase, partial [Nitrosopumilaceae archaeon]|nr:FKBP-type peptidyl-prolyl cis-trans isomerase [Nitrosopumilaceae archaeon]